MQSRDLKLGRPVVTRTARIGCFAAVAVLTLSSVAACSSSKKGAAKAPIATPSLSKYTAGPAVAAKTSGKAAPVPKVTHVLVTDTDGKQTVAPTTYTPGNYNFTLKNAGKGKHALEINGPGLKNQTGATVTAGQSTDLIVPLVKGTYELWSPVGGDKASGMDMHITVS